MPHGQVLLRMSLACLPRPSYGNAKGWTHTYNPPSHKNTRSIFAGSADVLRAARKVLPPVASGAPFQECEKFWSFGLMRGMQVRNVEEFDVYRSDMVGTLMPRYQRQFDAYTTTENPNFLETASLVDGGIGLNFDWHRHNAMRFESHHQKAKNDARKGAGKKVANVHAFHNHLVQKAVLAMDLELHTLGRIPPTRELRRRIDVVPKVIFDRRRSFLPHIKSQPALQEPHFESQDSNLAFCDFNSCFW